MKKLLLFLAALPLAVSCSNDDDDASQTPFFNLKEGNMWVYRKYQSDAQAQNPVATDQTDTVRVVGQEMIEGVSYYKLTHTVSNNTTGLPGYLRVDEQGHLVTAGGLVVHPGTDLDYTFTTPFMDLGTLSYYFDDQQYDYQVMDETYSIRPYVNYFTPYASGIEGVGQMMAYRPGLGFVALRNRYISGIAYFEYRLEHYELN